MDPDNLGRVFAPTLFRPLPSTQEVDPIAAFQEVNLQKVVIKFLISQYLDQTAELSISSFQLTDRMMSRLNRGQDTEEEEDPKADPQEEENRKGTLDFDDEILQDRTPFEVPIDSLCVPEEGKADNESDVSVTGSEEEERCCIVSTDLRAETSHTVTSLRLTEPLSLEEMEMNPRDEMYAAALNQFRHHRQGDEVTAAVPQLAEVAEMQQEQPNLEEEEEEEGEDDDH
jgi:hypothetical protein